MTSSASAYPAVIVPRPLRAELGRSHLLEQLADFEAQVIALIAPSGYGKTTLLAQYARNSPRRALWLTLGESDSDVDFFVASLCRAWESLLTPAQPCPEVGEAPERFVQRLVTTLAGADWGVDFFLDRTEMLGPNAGRLLASLLQQLPTGHRVLLSGYGVEGVPLARLVAAGRAKILDQSQLAFSGDECGMLLGARGYAGDPQQVFGSLEGWPAGVALAASGAALSLEPRDLVLEILATLSDTLQRRLPAASVLPVWSEAEVDGVLGLPPGWLDEVRRAGLPLTPLGQGVYRPHQLLLTTLDGLLRRGAERFQEVHRWRAGVCAAGGDPLAALRHATKAGDWERAVQLAGEEVSRLYARSEFALIHALLRDLPGETLSDKLREYRAVALIETGEVRRGEADLEALHQAGLTGAVGYTALALLAVRRGQFGRQLQLAEQGMARFPAGETFSLRLQRASALTSLDRVAEGLDACEALVREARERGARLEEARALVMLQYVHQVLGQWEAREACIRAAHVLFGALNQTARDIQLLDLLAEIDVMAGRHREAHAQLDRAFRAAEVEQPVILPQLRMTRALVYTAQNEFERADAELSLALEEARELHVEMLSPLVHLMRLDLLLGLRRDEKAGDALRAGLAGGSPTTEAHAAFYQGRWAFLAEKYAEAGRHFTRVVARYPDRFRQVRALAYLCELARLEGRLERSQLEDLAGQLGGLDVASVLALDRAPLQEIARESARLVPGHPLAALMDSAGPAADASQPTPGVKPVLDIRALGPLEVRLGGREVRMPLQKSGEILVWLALHGEGQLAQLLDALWDGSRDPKHHEYFRVAVRRLRARLTAGANLPFDPVPYDGRRYCLSPELDVRLDAGQVRDEVARGDLNALRRALAGYGGDFLPAAESGWAEHTREHLKGDLLGAASSAALSLEGTAPEIAAELYRSALRIDPHLEPLYVGLLSALVKFDLVQARQTYHKYARMMRDEFGAPPDESLARLLGQAGVTTPA